MIRIDMSEYMEKHSVSRLVGPPPGYIGYEEGGQLTEAVRRSPHSVVLLDELEKAHGDVLNILLQIMEDGMLTDGKGRTVSFKNAILVMTSNVGSKRILAESREGSTLPIEELYLNLIGVVKEELENEMKPELLNRMDEIVVFSPLANDDLSMIAELMLKQTIKRAEVERDMQITVTSSLIDRVRDEGSAQAAQFGARPMRRAAQRFLEDSISDALVRGFVSDGDKVTVDLGSVNGDKCTVLVIRERDGQSIEVSVEDSSGGIGSAESAVSKKKKKKKKIASDGVNGEASDDLLQTQTDPATL